MLQCFSEVEIPSEREREAARYLRDGAHAHHERQSATGPTTRKCFLVVGPVALSLWRCLIWRKHFLLVGPVAVSLWVPWRRPHLQKCRFGCSKGRAYTSPNTTTYGNVSIERRSAATGKPAIGVLWRNAYARRLGCRHDDVQQE
jgi:hypothetical protein